MFSSDIFTLRGLTPSFKKKFLNSAKNYIIIIENNMYMYKCMQVKKKGEKVRSGELVSKN